MQTIHLMSLLKNQNLLDNAALDEISLIDDDVIGTGIFLNILLSIGALFSVFFALAFTVTFVWLSFDFWDNLLWILLTATGAAFTGFGYWIYSHNSLFKLRMASFFILCGKIILIGAVMERINAFMGLNLLFQYSALVSLIALAFAIVNLYFAKAKLEIYLLLLLCLLAVKFFSSDLSSSLHDVIGSPLSPFRFEFFINCGLWVWAVLLLIKYNNTYRNRLPFYALMGAQIILTFFNYNIFTFFGDDGLTQFLTVIYNLILLAPSVYLVLKLQETSVYNLSWQYFACFALLFLLCFIPLPNFFMVLFAFLYGYTQRDRYILFSAYILTPIFIYNLYQRLDLDLSVASLMAMLIGCAFLMAYGIVRFSKFKQWRPK